MSLQPSFTPRRQTFGQLSLAFIIGVAAFVLMLFLVGIRPAHGLALADVAVQPPSFFMTTVAPALVKVLLDPTFLGIFGAVVLLLLRARFGDRAKAVEDAAEKAFNIVEDMKATGKLPAAAAKPVLALEAFERILKLKDVKATDAEIELAKAAWAALHGAQKANALVVTADPPATEPAK